MSPGAGGLFRDEAIAHHQRAREQGEALRISPGWTHWVFLLLLAAIPTLAVCAARVSVATYSEGACTLRAERAHPGRAPARGADEGRLIACALLSVPADGAVRVGDPLWIAAADDPGRWQPAVIASASPAGAGDVQGLGLTAPQGSGALVLVTADLPGPLLADGTPVPGCDGRVCLAQARIGGQPLLGILVPRPLRGGVAGTR